jgi:hypothetical protein
MMHKEHFWQTWFLKTLHVGCHGSRPLGNFLFQIGVWSSCRGDAPDEGLKERKSFRSVVELSLAFLSIFLSWRELPMPATCHIQCACHV